MNHRRPTHFWMAALALVTILSVVLSACGTPTPVPTAAPAPTKAAEPTKAPAAATAVPTKAPTAAPTVAPTKAPAAPKVLRMINGEPNVGLDPAKGNTALSLAVMELIHDPLVERDKDWKAIPWLAESWKVSADSTEWTFVLKPGLKFSDGSAITADDVKYSFDRLRDTAIWKGRMADVKSVVVKDARTVVLTMARSLPEFLDLAGAEFGYFVVSKAACEKGCDFSKPGTPVSGPWYLKEWLVKDHITLERNPYYGFAGLPKFDQVVYKFSDDRTGMANAIAGGTIDIMNPVNAPDAAKLLNSPDVKVYQGQRVDQMRGWSFDKRTPPFSDKRVRQAIGYIVEPDEINKTCWYGLANPLYGGVFYEQADKEWGTLLARNPWKKPRADRLTLAKQLLTDAGWVDTNNDGWRESKGVKGIADGTPLASNVAYEKTWVQSECQTLLLQQWGKEVGIKLTPDGRDKATYWPDVAARKHQMWHIGGAVSTIPWVKLQGFFHTTGSRAAQGWPDSPEADAKIDAMLKETDMAKRQKLMVEFVDWLADQQLVVATGSQDILMLATSKMTGFFAQYNGSWRAVISADILGR